MNLYLLVEGRRTECRLYPRWLAHLMPHFVRVPYPDEVRKNSYFLVSGEGYPRLLDKALPNAIKDVNAVGTFDYLILALDAEEAPIEDRIKEVKTALENQAERLSSSTSLRIIVQNRCIETWLLGNRRIFSRNPGNQDLQKYIEFYNVREKDPERMGMLGGFTTYAAFHLAYLQAIFEERNLQYGKYNTGHAGDQTYLQELIDRARECPEDLASFRVFRELIQNVAQLTNPVVNDGPNTAPQQAP